MPVSERLERETLSFKAFARPSRQSVRRRNASSSETSSRAQARGTDQEIENHGRFRSVEFLLVQVLRERRQGLGQLVRLPHRVVRTGVSATGSNGSSSGDGNPRQPDELYEASFALKRISGETPPLESVWSSSVSESQSSFAAGVERRDGRLAEGR